MAYSALEGADTEPAPVEKMFPIDASVLAQAIDRLQAIRDGSIYARLSEGQARTLLAVLARYEAHMQVPAVADALQRAREQGESG